ncbi:MAG: CHAT domain-containing protein [Desulfuromonadales bacterium]|nr:MAG: CHAT domain-containing protein [Desulfuromonadales bacterium]
MKTECCELEIGLHKRDAESYTIELSFSTPLSNVEVRPDFKELPRVKFDLDELHAHTFNPDSYGNILWRSIFSDETVREFIARAQGAAQSNEMPLRLRLFIDNSARELHDLHWETLRNPDSNSPLITSEQLLFSRYLSSFDWRPIRLRSRSALRALVVIANPVNLEDYSPGGRQLAPLDENCELERAKTGLGDISVTSLCSNGSATLANVINHMRDGYDILYIVCHGAFVKCEPWLLLEDDRGRLAKVNGADLVDRLRELQTPPRLVVLASCQSAGSGIEARSNDGGILASLGPRMAEASVASVVAMQGNISMTTIARFMPVFFRELRRDGQIDRAMAAARSTILSEPDWWIPTLFMRLESGSIWYEAGFAGDQQGDEIWPSLLTGITGDECTCTPILGSGLLESLFGSTREIARRWAETYNFPMEPHQREDLPQVSQYVEVRNGRQHLIQSLRDYLRVEIKKKYLDQIPDSLFTAPLGDLIEAVANKQWEQTQEDPYTVLANLPFSLYITTNQDNTLACALRKAGKEPRVDYCRWNAELATTPTIFESEPSYLPNAEKPLVFHLFGEIGNTKSLVITEDDYFAFLIGVAREKERIPLAVRKAFADSGLLFLGFQMEDWNFRVLLRCIISQEGNRRDKYAHVAVQIAPEEGRILKPKKAREFLESHFKKDYFTGAPFSIYWGSIDDFSKELNQQLNKRIKGGIP